MKSLLPLIAVLFSFATFAQQGDIKITDEKVNNRLFLYATNTTEKDLDVTMTVTGSGFRQSTRKPRPYRVPAASKVQVMSLVIERGKTPVYNADLTVSNMLNKRALRKPATPVKIEPARPILVYVTEQCTTCDAVLMKLDSSYYNYRKMVLAEKPEVKKTIAGSFKNTITPYETITNPIISLGGKLYSEIDSYDKLLEELKK